MSIKPSLPCSTRDVDLFISRPSPALRDMVRKRPGNFIILGAAGKMGLHLCLMLRLALDEMEDRRRVIAVSRFSSPDSTRNFERHGIEVVRCDLSVAGELDGLETAENVIFMAGVKFGTRNRPDLLHRMNVEMPRQVASKFRKSHITVFSTGCVYSYHHVDGRGPTETDHCQPIGEYAKSCLGREKAFLEATESHGTPVSLIRLNYSVEFRYGVPVDIAKKIIRSEPISLAMGHANIIWQRDAVLYSLLAHGHTAPSAFILNVTRPEVLRIRDIAIRMGELLGRDPVFEGTEEPEAWISDPTKAIKLFGEPETSVDEILRYVAAWQLNDLPTLEKPTGFEKRDGNF